MAAAAARKTRKSRLPKQILPERRHLHWLENPDGSLRPVGLLEWARWFETAGEERIIRQDLLYDGKVKISTVFMGLDHAWQGPPQLYETMVFGEEREEFLISRIVKLRSSLDCWRYATRAEAEAGHLHVLELAKAVN